MKFLVVICLFLLTKNFGQIEKPKYILASKSFYSHNSMGFVVRYDAGIDSINIPIDSNKIKINIIKLDKNGSNLSDKKIYYEYRFTPKINGNYKLSNGKIWSHKNSFNMIFDDSIKLKIPEPIIKLSKTDSIALEIKKQNENLEQLAFYENERKESHIDSRIIENSSKNTIVKLWTDKIEYNINDNVRIILECNKDFYQEKLKLIFKNNSENKLKPIKTICKQIYDNDHELYYKIFIYQSLDIGAIEIDPIKIIIEGKELKTDNLQFTITKN